MKTCWAQYALWIVIVALGIASLLGGCGQKGPLYLPDENKLSQAVQSDAPES